ncbi:MAG: hypothetical protein ACRD2O_08130, partial [Terriglobia bacterium]
MKMKRLAFMAATLLVASAAAYSQAALAAVPRPNRVLLVIGRQWDDPSGFLVREGNEFHELASLLKNWGIPFDILRLDQERLDPDDFIGFDGKPLYGAILWDADPAKFKDQNYGVLNDAVEKWSIGLVALSNRIRHPVLEALLGLHYRGYYSSSAPIVPDARGDFLLAGLPNPLDTNDDPRIELTAKGVLGTKMPWQFPPFKDRVLVDDAGATVLSTQGGIPQITQRQVRPGTYAIWIGSDYLSFLHYQALRTVLRRALALAVGYQLYRDWSRDAILEMDDVGSAQNSWLESWHYATLTEEQIEKRLIEPLQKHHALLAINACPGFVDRKARRIVPSFQQVFTDEFGTHQDYISTKRGLDEGLKRGVFEIQSHGWTHIQPDLDSPPGPWWDAPLYEEKAEVGWYREFGDTRRDKEIPAAVQRRHLENSITWLEREFGVTPLSFVAGGNGISEPLPNNTTVLAARAGFGWFGDYIGPDLAIEALLGYSGMGGSEFGGTSDAPLVVWIPPDGHDRGISQHPDQFAQIFDQLRGWNYGSMNAYIAYLHAHVHSMPGSGLMLQVSYDPHFCRYFANHPSEWQIEI